MRRIAIPELLDSDSGTAREVADSLADLRWFNRYFGGTTTTCELLGRVVTQAGLGVVSLLDVAAASSDGASAARSRLAKSGISLETTILDRSPDHLPPLPDRLMMTAVAGDALQLPFADRSFDVVGNSLFLHHLEPPQVETFLREALRVCRIAVIVNDLRRSRFQWLVAMAGMPLYRSRLTRHDAPASVRRAYTPAEMEPILNRIGASRIEWSRHYFCRMGIILWRTRS